MEEIKPWNGWITDHKLMVYYWRWIVDGINQILRRHAKELLFLKLCSKIYIADKLIPTEQESYKNPII